MFHLNFNYLRLVFFILLGTLLAFPNQGFGGKGGGGKAAPSSVPHKEEKAKEIHQQGIPQMPRPNAEYTQLVGVTDLRSKFSDGCFTIKTLAEMCVERKIEAMIVMDHDRYSLEYGIFPFRNLLRKKVEKSSLLLNGAENYLRAFENIKYEFENLVAIPGVESAPFYYWSGNIFSKDLTANEWENHISIVGMGDPKDYNGLPTLDSNFSTKYSGKFSKGFIFFFLSALVGAVMILWEGYFRIGGIAILAVNLLLMICYHPFRSSPFDQYHGPQGVAPWQLTIDYANERGGLTFWHHLESSSGIGQKGPINVNTPPHPQDLLLTYGYTGFQAVYEDTITVTEPGHEWDQALMQFLRGERNNAIWGIGGHDYHCEGTSNIRLNDVKTVFLVASKTQEGVLAAMRTGKMYAVRQAQQKDYRLSLDEFSIKKKDGSELALMGDAISLAEKPNIHIKISTTDRKDHEVTLSIIRSGEKIKELPVTTPADFQFEDDYFQPGETVFYRLKAYIHGDNYLIANPIFVLFEGEKGPMEAEKPKEIPIKEEGPKAGEAIPPKHDVSPPPTAPEEKAKGIEEKPKEELPKATEIQPTPEKEKETSAPKQADLKKVALINSSSVYLRKDPGINFENTGEAKKGSHFELLEPIDAIYNKFPWLKVTEKQWNLDSVSGGLAEVVQAEAQNPPKATKTQPAPEEKKETSAPKQADLKKVALINSSSVYLRKDPGINFENTGEAKKGSHFELLEPIDAIYNKFPWLKVTEKQGNSDSVSGGLAEVVQAEAQNPPKATKTQPAPEEKKETSAPEKADLKKIVRISGSTVYLRKGPGANFEKSGQVQMGDRFELLETTDAIYNKFPWLKVMDEQGNAGYVWGGLAEVVTDKEASALPAGQALPSQNPNSQNEDDQEAAKKEKTFAVISMDEVILREGPGMNYPQLGITIKGARFRIVEKLRVFHQGKPWLKVADKEGKEGFVWEGLVKISEGKNDDPLSSINFPKGGE